MTARDFIRASAGLSAIAASWIRPLWADHAVIVNSGIKYVEIKQFAFEKSNPAHAPPDAFLPGHAKTLFVLIMPALVGVKNQTGSARYLLPEALWRIDVSSFWHGKPDRVPS